LRIPRVFAAASFALATLVPGAPALAASCQLVRIVDWPVRVVRNHIFVDGAINGSKVDIVLDTGAQHSTVLPATVKRLELPAREVPGARGMGIGGEFTLRVATIDALQLGDAPPRSTQLWVAGENEAERGFDLLLGEDFLQRFDVEFDLPHNAVRLFQARDCGNASLAYWTKDAVGEVEIDPIREAQPSIIFPVSINDRRIDALLDSGASVSVLGKQDAADAGVTPGSPGVVGAGKLMGLGARSVDMWTGGFASFAIGNERISDIRIAFADVHKDQSYAATGSNLARRALPTRPMFVGADFLRAHRLLVAHSQRRMYFSYTGGPVFAAPNAPNAAPPGDGAGAAR
jgi:predicted aspartyl protease